MGPERRLNVLPAVSVGADNVTVVSLTLHATSAVQPVTDAAIRAIELEIASNEPLPMRCPASQLSSMKWITEV